MKKEEGGGMVGSARKGEGGGVRERDEEREGRVRRAE